MLHNIALSYALFVVDCRAEAFSATQHFMPSAIAMAERLERRLDLSLDELIAEGDSLGAPCEATVSF